MFNTISTFFVMASTSTAKGDAKMASTIVIITFDEMEKAE